MTNDTPQAIKNAALGIRAYCPTLATGQYVSLDIRDRLVGLAIMAGLTRDAANAATDNDLIGIWSVAYRDGAMAGRVAARVAARLAPPANLFDPVPSATATPSSASAGVGLDVIRDLIKHEVREGALDPLQHALQALDDSLRGDFADLLASASASALQAMREVIEAEAALAASEAVKSLSPTILHIASPGMGAPVVIGLAHYATADVIDALADGVNVYLHGPAGAGKTTVCAQVAKAFGVKAYYAAKVENEYQLMGFINGTGLVRTAFRDAYEFGGVFLFDEMDASASQAIVALNMALANGVCAFPDGVVERHPQFYCIGAGNTVLSGATRLYNGRNALDGASVDRFAFIEFGYDDDLERTLAVDAEWCAYVQRVRAVIAERELAHLVTPRATYDGCKLLASGKRSRDKVADMVIWKGLDRDTVAQIKAAL